MAADGVVSGEDWAECLVHELAKLIGVPTVTVSIASYQGARGVVSRNLAPNPLQLEHGDELLAAVEAAYDPRPVRNNPFHTITAVKRSLDGLSVPTEYSHPQVRTAFDLWAGYLVMDAWVSGTDRHPQNWAVLRHHAQRWLAPSYDHGNALGFQLRDAERDRHLNDDASLRRSANRGSNAYFYGSPRLVALAHEALESATSAARRHWIGQLHRLEWDSVQGAVASVPTRLRSDVGRSFVLKLLVLNRERILNAYTGGS